MPAGIVPHRRCYIVLGVKSPRLVVVAIATVLVAGGTVGGLALSAGPAPKRPLPQTKPPVTAPTTAPMPTATAPTTAAPAKTVQAGPTTRYADIATSGAVTYTADAWCNPLEDASGRSLAALEDDVAAGTGQLDALSSPSMVQALAPSLGQVALSPLARPTGLADLATATAIVPVSADPSTVTLRTAYCFAAVQPLTGYQVTAQGGSAVVDFEAAYSLSGGGHVSWWHLWWETAVTFGPCGQSVCLTNWKLPGKTVLYWASQAPSTAPKYVVPGLSGTWQLSYPPG